MDGEDAVLVEEGLGQRNIVLMRGPAAQPEGGDRAIHSRLFGRQDLHLRQADYLLDPAIAQGPQPGLATGAADRRLEAERGGDGQLDRIVDRPGMDASADIA